MAALTNTTDRAVAKLRDALAAAGITLPSLGADAASPYLSLIQLGRVNADVALKLADVISRGAR
ncbi:hypothetical protein [Streptomyces sp. RPT161]|uniref:hypothetical protein n=1 Tax=Streptomyces sp. RPT161 TaxID=3015993 RepID=UPI0022B89B0E|nr:hypothetical protein [Streptomyces sp. RPT161]